MTEGNIHQKLFRLRFNKINKLLLKICYIETSECTIENKINCNNDNSMRSEYINDN